jgi:protease-4
MNQQSNQNNSQIIEVKPKAPFLTFFYVLFSLPSFILSIFITFFSIVFILIALISSANSTAQSLLEYETIQTSDSSDTVLIYELNGTILTGDDSLTKSARLTGIYTNIVQKDFEIIKKDNSIKNVVFKINSPGGSVFASEILGDLINDLLSSKGQTQAVFYFDEIVASGGLWAAYKVTDNYVAASPYGQTGSIGVLLSVGNFKKLADNIGYKETVIKSSESKDYGNPLRDLTQSETQFLQEQINVQYNKFVNIVATGRDLDATNVRNFANGYVYSNDIAKGYGLIDDLGGIDLSIQRAASNASLSEYNVKRVKTEANPFARIFGKANFSQILGIDGINEAAKKITSFELKPGVVYAIDENRI